MVSLRLHGWADEGRDWKSGWQLEIWWDTPRQCVTDTMMHVTLEGLPLRCACLMEGWGSILGSRETKGKIGTSLELKGLWENGGKYLGTSSGTKCVTVWQLFSGTSSHCKVGIEHHQNCLNNNWEFVEQQLRIENFLTTIENWEFFNNNWELRFF